MSKLTKVILMICSCNIVLIFSLQSQNYSDCSITYYNTIFKKITMLNDSTYCLTKGDYIKSKSKDTIQPFINQNFKFKILNDSFAIYERIKSVDTFYFSNGEVFYFLEGMPIKFFNYNDVLKHNKEFYRLHSIKKNEASFEIRFSKYSVNNITKEGESIFLEVNIGSYLINLSENKLSKLIKGEKDVLLNSDPLYPSYQVTYDFPKGIIIDVSEKEKLKMVLGSEYCKESVNKLIKILKH